MTSAALMIARRRAAQSRYIPQARPPRRLSLARRPRKIISNPGHPQRDTFA